MSHFYGTMKGSRGEATRCGTKKSGLRVTAASWSGAIEVYLTIDGDGRDCFEVRQRPWQGQGVGEILARGVIGEPQFGLTKRTGV